MKTAEELAIQVRDLLRFYSVYPNAKERQLMYLQEKVKQIQQDARYSVLSEAAEIVNVVLVKRDCDGGINDYGFRLAIEKVESAILALRDKKES